MNTSPSLQISAEVTPNPNTLKFVVNRNLLEHGSVDFPDKEKAKESPVASQLFELDSVNGVFIGTNFITVTKSPEADWNQMVGPVADKIRTVLNSTSSVVAKAEVSSKESEGPIEQKIREILDREIRPAVAMDGGDITFLSYREGVVTLHLQGSCSSCPSSIMTLKMGVENRLRSEIPEVKEVVQV